MGFSPGNALSLGEDPGRKPLSLGLRCRGGPTQGWGNIYRLTAFAQRWRELHGARPHFFVEGPPSVQRWFVERGHPFTRLEEDLCLAEEAAILSAHAPLDMVVMEMLDCSLERQRLLRAHSDFLVVFDDLLDHRYCADLVVCGQELPGYGNRALSDSRTRFLIGYDYFLMPEHFLAPSAPPRRQPDRVQNILVSFGGGRYDLAYLKVAAGLSSLDRDFAVRIVLGPAADSALRRELEELLPRARILGGVENLAEELRAADLVFSSAGYTKIEAAFCETPAIMISTQWHQLPLGETFAARSGGIHLGSMGAFAPRDVQVAIDRLSDAESRTDLAQRARRLVDGRGFERVCEQITQMRGSPSSIRMEAST